MASLCRFYCIYITMFSYICLKPYSLRSFTENDLRAYRNKVVQMFRHAYDSYLRNAFPYDELQPISCRGMDTWGSFSLTLIDALDTLAVMQNFTEFRRVVKTLLDTADFNVNINVSVFETNIRVVGGLLSAHLLSKRAGLDVDPGWPCSGPLLNLAEKVARRLLPAFKTKTGMPYGTVNLRYGVPADETPITCTAGVSTFILEFGTLSQLTGDSVFETVALNALDALWKRRSSIGLVGNHINVQDGKWTALDSGIGGGVDSYFEYLVKGAILFQEPKFLKMFREYERVISKYMKKDDWYFWVSMNSGQVTMPTFQSLEAFWPGLLTLVGDIEQALKTLYNYHRVWKQYGFTPEIYDVSHSHAKRESYPLRPELVESIMYLYYATKDEHLLEIGVDILESIEHSARTDCGYATIKNVVDHKIEDRMESFFLAETTKYLYLLFDPDNFIHNNGSCGNVVYTSGGKCILGAGGYVFNTEAHPIDIAAVYCCSAKHKDHKMVLYNFHSNMDLHSLLEINNNKSFLKLFQHKRRHNSKLKENNSTTTTNGTLNSAYLNNYETPDISSEHNDTDDINSTIFETVSEENKDVGEKYIDDLYSASTNNEDIISPNLSTLTSKETSHDQTEHSNKLQMIPSTNDKVSLKPSEKFTVFPNTDVKKTGIEKETQRNSTIEFFELEDENESSPSDVKVGCSKSEVFASSKPSTSIPFTSMTNNDESALESSSSDIYDKEFHNYELLSCPAQRYTSRFSIMGEVFNT